MRTYESYKLSKAYLFFSLGLMLALSLFSIYVFSAGLGSIRVKMSLPPHLLVIWCGVLVVLWLSYLRFPLEIRFQDDQTLEFRRILGTISVPVREITVIQGMFLRPGYLTIKHNRGTVWLICQMTGLYELIYMVKSLNPAVEIKDC